MRSAVRARRWRSVLSTIFMVLIICFTGGSAGCGKATSRSRGAAPGNEPGAVYGATGAGGATPRVPQNEMRATDQPAVTGEAYDRIFDNPFHLALYQPLSTFSISVDTASYSNTRRFLKEGRLPPKDAVRVEEFVNYFHYDYPQPQGPDPIAIHTEIGPCPWDAKHQLVRIGLQGKTIREEDVPSRNLVFLVDTSGSMYAANRLPLLKQALALLVRKLNARDRVSIVTYAGTSDLRLAATPGNQREKILSAIGSLEAAGSTNGGEGIVLAYRIAQENFIKGGANRVILGTDGDFNVGVTGADLIRLIEDKRKTGVFLTVLGFGMGNLKDNMLEKLAQHGNGQYAYIDTFAEAQKVFVQDIGGLVCIAKDVKVQVDFNSRHVQAYRLIGYEQRLLKSQDFNDDTKDAGDVGAGHTVTALYEIVPPGVHIDLPKEEASKYQKQPQPADAGGGSELLTVKVRYTLPEEAKSKLLTLPVHNVQRQLAESSVDFRFAAAVASFAMLLRASEYRGNAGYASVLELARGAIGPDRYGHRAEFLTLVETAQRLSPR
jgi:Ca-activated chloride channel family protein